MRRLRIRIKAKTRRECFAAARIVVKELQEHAGGARHNPGTNDFVGHAAKNERKGEPDRPRTGLGGLNNQNLNMRPP